MQGGKQYIHYPALDLAKRTAVNIRVAAGTKLPQQAIVSARQYPARHPAVEPAQANGVEIAENATKKRNGYGAPP